MKPLLLLLSLATTAFADLTPSESELMKQLGPDTPRCLASGWIAWGGSP
ncbi:MAG: hypothetical protein ACKVY0_27755 [Prosthecobacter sp.]